MAGGRAGHVNIKHVAARAGVSTATAGRVLGGYGYASKEITDRVQAAASDLGYRANGLARGLITGKTQTIGVVAGDIQSPFYYSILRGISDVARAEGLGVLLTNTDERIENEIEAVKLLLEKQVDGLIVAPIDPNTHSHLEVAVQRGVALVQIDRRVISLQSDSVTLDNAGAAYQCTKNLLDLGHRRIAMVIELRSWGRSESRTLFSKVQQGSVILEQLSPSVQRLCGFFSAVIEAKISFDPSMIVRTGDYSAQSAQVATLEVLSRSNRPTALLPVDGLMSQGTMQAIAHLGLQLPKDLSLICFDDLDWMNFINPGISAVRQPLVLMGNAAARLLQEGMDGAQLAPRHLRHSAEIVNRGSTGLPFDRTTAGVQLEPVDN